MQAALSRFLEANRASKFQKFFDANPELNKIEGKYTLILAPDDETFDRLSTFAGNDRETIVNILKNHISIVKVNKVGHPTVTALSGLQFGSNINDLKRLEITAANNNAGPGLVVFVIKKFISIGVQQAEQTEEINYLLKLNQDVFVQLLTQYMEPTDIIRLCNSNSMMNAKCNHNGQALFRILLKRDYNVEINANSPANFRDMYIRAYNSKIHLQGCQYFEYPIGYQEDEEEEPLCIASSDNLEPIKVNLINVENRLHAQFKGFKIIVDGDKYRRLAPRLNTRTHDSILFLDRMGNPGYIDYSLVLRGKSTDPAVWYIDHTGNYREIHGSVKGYIYCLNSEGIVYQYDKTDRKLRVLRAPFKFKSIAIGYNHWLCLDMNGRVWTKGNNSNGQLGREGTSEFEMIPGFEGVKQIAAGYKYSAFLDKDGRVWTFGSNSYSKLGLDLGSLEYKNPMVIKKFENVKKISCGPDTMAIIDQDGRVWMWGEGVHMNIKSSPINIISVDCGDSGIVLIDENRRVWTCSISMNIDTNNNEFTLFPGGENVIQAISRHKSVIILK